MYIQRTNSRQLASEFVRSSNPLNCSQAVWWYPDSTHPHIVGNRVVAECLARLVGEAQVVRTTGSLALAGLVILWKIGRAR